MIFSDSRSQLFSISPILNRDSLGSPRVYHSPRLPQHFMLIKSITSSVFDFLSASSWSFSLEAIAESFKSFTELRSLVSWTFSFLLRASSCFSSNWDLSKPWTWSSRSFFDSETWVQIWLVEWNRDAYVIYTQLWSMGTMIMLQQNLQNHGQ